MLPNHLFFEPFTYLLAILIALVGPAILPQQRWAKLLPLSVINILFLLFFLPVQHSQFLWPLLFLWFLAACLLEFSEVVSKLMNRSLILMLLIITLGYLFYFRTHFLTDTTVSFLSFSLLFLISRWFFAARFLFLQIKPSQIFSKWLPVQASSQNKMSNSFYALLIYANWLIMAPLNFIGPIVSPRDYQPASMGLVQQVIMLKKFALGSFQALYLAPFFASLPLKGGQWWDVLTFTIALYFQFQGFSLAAQAYCYALGVEVPENFNKPWLARTPPEIWNRWHISLNQALRELVYLPLNSFLQTNAIVATIISTILVWLISALWHGFTLNFILWGVYWATILILFNLFQRSWPQWNQRKTHVLLMRLLSLVLFIVGNIFFY